MSNLSGMTAGLAFLPNWLSDVRDNVSLEALFSGWVRTSGWRSAGLAWAVEPHAGLSLLARPDGVQRSVTPPPELSEVEKSLGASTGAGVYEFPNSFGKLYAAITAPGLPYGYLWAERYGNEAWSDLEKNYFKLSARLIERSSALSVLTGARVEPERLAQRLQDVSLIAGSMGHDFNNLLTGIIGFADLSIPLLPANSLPFKYVTEISKAGERGMNFVHQLHQLSRSGQTKPQPSSLGAAVGKEQKRLQETALSNVQLVTALPPSLPAVAIESGSLGHIVGHLVANAAEATPAGGRVVVTAELVELSVADAKSYLGQVHPGQHVQLTVRDQGTGIKPETRAKLFVEPFHTTKVRHRGLGLAIVYRTLCAHRGGIRIESAPRPDTGTTVRVVLPPAVAVRATATPSLSSSTTLGG